MSIEPVKGARHDVLLVDVLEIVTTGALFPTAALPVTVQPLPVSVIRTVYAPPSTPDMSSVDAVNPFGPVHAYVNGPALPATVRSIAPSKGVMHLVLSV